MINLSLVLVLIWSAAMLIVFAGFRQKAKIESCRYRLFRCRDELFRLATVHALDEGNPVFQELSALLNGLIRHLEHFTLDSFAQAYMTVEAQNLANSDRMEKFEAELNAASPVVQEVAIESVRTILGILYDSSPVLRILLRLRTLVHRAGISMKGALLGHPPQAYEAYRVGELRLRSLPRAFSA
jgi:hypothetical protein